MQPQDHDKDNREPDDQRPDDQRPNHHGPKDHEPKVPAAEQTLRPVAAESAAIQPVVSGDERISDRQVTEGSIEDCSFPASSERAAGPKRWRFSAVLDFLWTAIAIPAVSLVVFLLASLVMMVIAYAVVHGQIDQQAFSDQDAMRSVSESRIGLLLMIVAPQFALVAPALLAATFSSVQFRNRLSLVRGHWPIWAWIAAAATTPLIGWISSIAVGTLMDESENLKIMSDIFRGHGQSGFLIPLAILIGATPAFCEELLFRGYVQTRLGRRFGVVVGILISSLLFALFHMDWVHVIAVFPLGLFLGTITWRSGSLFPAMLAHFVNNSISVFAVVLAPEQQDQMPSLEMGLFLLVVLGASLLGAVVTAIAFWRIPAPSPSLAAATEPVFR